jgi:hypothetical protein
MALRSIPIVGLTYLFVGLMIYFSFKVEYIKSKVLKLGNNYKSTKSSRILKKFLL